MIAGVADTHAILWYLFKNPKLSGAAREFMDNGASEGHDIAVSAISLAEIVYLIEKGRVPQEVYPALKRILADPENVIKEAPLNAEIVDALQLVSRDAIPDMPDRIVAATAVYFNVPVINGDGRIRASSIRTVW